MRHSILEKQSPLAKYSFLWGRGGSKRLKKMQNAPHPITTTEVPVIIPYDSAIIVSAEVCRNVNGVPRRRDCLVSEPLRYLVIALRTFWLFKQIRILGVPQRR